MQWLFENPLANMPGPSFLGLYGALLVGAILALRIQASRIEKGESDSSLPIPDPLDPYQIAFLRGGDGEVIRTAMVDLVEQGRIAEVPSSGVGKMIGARGAKWSAVDPLDPGTDLAPIPRTLLQSFRAPRTPESVFEPEIRSSLQDLTAPFQEWIDRESLAVDSEDRSKMTKLLFLLLVGIEVIGGYKLLSALVHNRFNIAFLAGMMVFAGIILPICAKHRRLTQKGRDFLRDLQTAFGSLRMVKHANSRSLSSHSAIGNASIPLVAMGLFGVNALQGSEFDPIYRSYQRATANGSGCSSCGASSCGSSAEYGSTSSCGSGSSCGGGGCGGCGGGGD